MKKLISMLLVFVLVLCSLALVSCSDDKNTSSDSEESKNENTSNTSESSNTSDDAYVPDVSVPGKDTVVGRYNGEIDFSRYLTLMFGENYGCDSFVVTVGFALNEDGTSDMYVIKYQMEEKHIFYESFAKALYDVATGNGYEGTLEDFIKEAGGISGMENSSSLDTIINIFDGKYTAEDGKLVVTGKNEQGASYFHGTVADGIVKITGEYDANGNLIDGESIFPIELKNIYA